MRRLTFLARANLAVRDSLHALRIAGDIRWHGASEIVRRRFPGIAVRLRHQTATRSAAIVKTRGEVPAEVGARERPLDPGPAPARFGRAVIAGDCDALVLSMQPDVMTSLARHRRDGYRFFPANAKS
jgi:hypothetical protein